MWQKLFSVTLILKNNISVLTDWWVTEDHRSRPYVDSPLWSQRSALCPSLILFVKIIRMKPRYIICLLDNKIMLYISAHFEGLQDKLAQVRDAREALDSLRDEYREKIRREQEELERQRQIQMGHKLEIMRQKKQVSYTTRIWHSVSRML